ncbi:MAG: TonB-dependent receptor [Tannerella sp.]|jgi:TonB-linked SusC/RagA family outer membrane protein|nr:TonB-dependent receptor [Tannerella sp.]
MKASIFLLFVCTLPLIAENLDAQTVNIELERKELSVRQLISVIENQTDFLVLFRNNDIDVDRIVRLKNRAGNLIAFLDETFHETGISYRIRNKYIVLSKQPFADAVAGIFQQSGKRITGTVTDTNGEAIIGANIVEKETTNGVITDHNGYFSLNVAGEETVLQISYIGYITQSITVGTQTTLNITLREDTQTLEEVVVIGYGTARKKDITGSVVRADISKLRESPNVSLGQSLQGTVPGLNVGAVTQAGTDPGISIRGRNTISGSASPLIVLDGIIYRGSLVDINPNDIESIDVLKDASAAAIYGSQASNGVMLITSKTVKVMSKPVIEYSGSYTLQESTNQKMRPMNREGYLQLVADRFLEESRMGSDLLQPNPNWDPSIHFMDGNAVKGYLNGTETDWWDLGTNDQPYIQMHDLSVRGRNELSSYFMSVGLTDQQNLVINDTYKRYNIRLNLDTRITKWLKVGAQTFFVLSDWSGIAGVSSDLPPVCAITDPETGEYVIYPFKTTLNPALTRQQDNLDKRYNLFGNFYVDADIPFVKGLNYRLNFSQNLITDKDFTFNPWGTNLTGSGNKQNSSQYNWTADHILTWKRTFGKHDINSTLVYGVEKRQNETTNASGSNFANDVLGYNYLAASAAAQRSISSDAWEESSLYTMLRLGYTYNSRYSFTGTLRRDGFSGFGKDNKFALFPSAAVAWNLSEERFVKDNVKWIDNLKLRLSYGSNGNRTVSRYQTLARMSTSDAYFYGDGASVEKGLSISAMANDNLKWETTNSFNIGLDFSVLNGRLSGYLEYYRSNTFDLLYSIDIPRLNNNIASIPTNIGKLANRGQELNLTGIPVQTRDFSWTVAFNWSLNRNKVVSILGMDKDGDGREDDLVSSKIFMNRPYGVCYDFELIGMWQMEDYRAGIIPEGFTYGTYKVSDLDGDGMYTTANDRKILGYTDPSYRFSIENVLRYKNWELKAFINSIQGGKDYYYAQPGSVLANPDNIYQNNRYKWDYWTPENPNARYRQIGYFSPALGNPYSPYIQRSFVRLQNLTLSWRVPSALLKKAGMNNFKVYATGTNLFTITDWDGWDPETGTGLGGDYPLLRTYSMGINFDF